MELRVERMEEVIVPESVWYYIGYGCGRFLKILIGR